MKIKIISIIALSIILLGLCACDKDESPKLKVSEAPELRVPDNTEFNLKELYNSISGDNVNTLREQLEATTAQTFSWSKGQFGYMAAGNYYLEISDTTSFESVFVAGSAYNVFLPVSVKTLNTAALNFQPEGVYDPITLYLRVRCAFNDVVGNNEKSIYSSNIVSINVTPYEAEKIYPTIYIVGTPNGWDINAATCPLISKNGDDIYTGIFNFNNFAATGNANTMRFYTKLGNWDANSLGSQVDDNAIDITGDFKSGVYSGKLVSGKGSFSFTQDGTFTVTVNTAEMTVTFTQNEE